MGIVAHNRTQEEWLVIHGRAATSFLDRLRGLIGRVSLQAGEGLLIRPCSGIHTIGMRYAVDVVFLDAAGRVVKTAVSVRPNRVGPIALGAAAVLELPEGTIARTGTRVGDVIDIG